MKTLAPLFFITALLCITSPLEAKAKKSKPVRDFPFRINPADKPVPNGTTVLLWSFDDGNAKDSAPGENDGKLSGKTRSITKGRYGKGLAFQGGRSSSTIRKFVTDHLTSQGRMSFDFWIKLDALPSKKATVMETILGMNLKVDLNSQGQIVVTGPEYESATSPTKLKTDKWYHLCLSPIYYKQPNDIYFDRMALLLHIDGKRDFYAWRHSRHVPVEKNRGLLVLGDSFQGGEGAKMLIDEFRVSRGIDGVIEMRKDDPSKPVITQSLKRTQKHFRYPERIVLQADFNNQATSKKLKLHGERNAVIVRPPMLKTISGGSDLMKQVDDVGEDAELDAELGKLDEEAENEAAGIFPIMPTAGYVGSGLRLDGGRVRLPIKKKYDVSRGTLEMWIRPENWDNLTDRAEQDAQTGIYKWKYENRDVHIATLIGKDKSSRNEIGLVKLYLSRVDGALKVEPQWEEYFGTPFIKIYPGKWIHILITWEFNFPFLNTYRLNGKDGHLLSGRSRVKFAKAEEFKNATPLCLEIGSGFVTTYDEIRIYDHIFEGAERPNSYTSFTGEQMIPLAEDTINDAFKEIGDIAIEKGDSKISRIGGAWKDGWVTGTANRGPVRTFFGYKPSVNQIIVAVAPLDASNVDHVNVKFEVPGKPAITGKIPKFVSGKGGVILKVGELPPGNYRTSGELIDFDGKKIADFSCNFSRKKMEGINHDIGVLDTPPDPFIPVKLTNQRIDIIERSQTVGADGNFTSIKVRGEEILAAPIHFEVSARGKESKLSGSDLRFSKSNPVESNWSAQAKASGLTVSTKVKLTYEGLTEYEITLAPEGKAMGIKHFRLNIPLKPKYAWLYHILGTNIGLRNPHVTGMLDDKQGHLWNSRDNSSDLSVSHYGNFIPQMWLGGYIRGIVWYADNSMGWVNTVEKPAISIDRRGEEVVLSINFISTPFKLDKPRTIRYSLLATPPKPLPKDHRLWGRGDTKTHGAIAGRIMSCDSFAPFIAKTRRSTFSYRPRFSSFEYVKLSCERQRKSGHGKYPPKGALMIYHDKNKNPLPDEMMPYYGWLWGNSRFPKSKIDYMVWNIDQFLKAGYDGIYIDDVFPIGDWNEIPFGTSYFLTLPDGSVKKQVGSPDGPYHRYVKRLYGLFHKQKKAPIITTHMTSTVGWPYHTHATVVYDHEQAGRFGGKISTFMDAWPIDYLLALDNPERTGCVTIPMIKGQYIEDRSEIQQWSAMRSFRAVWLLFDMHKILKGTALRDYEGTDVEVMPFWRNQHLLKVQPIHKSKVVEIDLPTKRWWVSKPSRKHIAKEPVKATLFKKGNRCLVIASNWLRKSTGAEISLQLSKLGIKGRVTVHDVDDEPIPELVTLEGLHIEKLREKKMALPKIQNLGDGLSDEEEMDEDIGGLEEEIDPKTLIKRSNAKFLAVSLKDGKLRLNIPPHNFRAIELRWGP